MMYNVYVVYDKVAEEAGPPFCAVNDGIAMRQYASMGIPEALQRDYTLNMIGYYDSKDMCITPHIIISVVSKEETNV